MNINPIGISAYDKSEVSRKNLDPAQAGQEQFEVETRTKNNGEVAKADANRVALAEQDKSVTMARRDAETSSALAVKAQSGFSQLLSPEERQAIEMLFAKYTENSAAETSYSARGQETHTPRLGAKVDYRV